MLAFFDWTNITYNTYSMISQNDILLFDPGM